MTYSNALKLFSSADTGAGSADRLRALLSCLGNPERQLSVIPVVGDKGKSSVVRMLSAVLTESGVSSAAVTYPCLRTPRDSVAINGGSLSNEAFVLYASRLSEAIRTIRAGGGDGALTREELLFALALLAGRDRGVKWLILEIPSDAFSPLSVVRFSAPLTVITSCGPSVGPHVTGMLLRGLTEAVSAWLPYPSSYRTISGACARAGCRLTVPAFSAVHIIESSLRRTVFTYRGRQYTLPLYGEFAVSNALCAIEAVAALRRLGCPVTDSGERAGLCRASLPARGEILSCSPTLLVDAASDALSEEALLSLVEKKGTALGSCVTLCVERPETASRLSPRLESLGFTVRETVLPEIGREDRVAARLLKHASGEELILTVGALPFAFTMRNEFLKVLRSN